MQVSRRRQLAQASAIIEEIKADQGLRARGQASLTEYRRAMYSMFADGYHLRCLDNVLERVALHVESGGEDPRGIPKLLISMPRQHTKSTGVGTFVSWFIGRNPNEPVIITSFGQKPVNTISRMIRNLVDRPEYQDFFPGIYLADDSRSKNEWKLDGFAGGVTARPVQSGATSYGYKLLIADDLVRNREDAESPEVLQKIWDELNDSFFSGRHGAKAADIVIGTRWTVDDPIGRLLERDGDDWVYFKLPALVDEPYVIRDRLGEVLYERQPDEPLWAYRYSVEELREMSAKMLTSSWMSLWQQEPIETEGEFFKREWFGVVSELPELEYVVRYWDLAMSAKKTADYTVGLKMGAGVDGRHYILDVQRWRVEFGELVDRMAEVMIADGPMVSQGIEKAGYMTRAIEELNADPRLHGYSVMGYGVDKDEKTRAMPLQGRLQNSLIKLWRAGWNEDFVNEMCAFIPKKSKFDDQVDAACGAWAMMDTSLEAGWTSWM